MSRNHVTFARASTGISGFKKPAYHHRGNSNLSIYSPEKVFEFKNGDGGDLVIKKTADQQALYMQNHIPEIYEPMRCDSSLWNAKHEMEKQQEFEEMKIRMYEECRKQVLNCQCLFSSTTQQFNDTRRFLLKDGRKIFDQLYEAKKNAALQRGEKIDEELLKK